MDAQKNVFSATCPLLNHGEWNKPGADSIPMDQLSIELALMRDPAQLST